MTRAYRIVLSERAERELTAIDRTQQTRIVRSLARLATNPRCDPQVRRLSGQEEYRFRVGGYRILFVIEEDELIVLVVDIGHRREVYR